MAYLDRLFTMPAIGTEKAWKRKATRMAENIMFIPTIVLMVVEAVALVFMIWAWRDAKKKRRTEDEKSV